MASRSERALLYGPPGCGKTFIAEKFAEEAGLNFRYVKPSDLASIYVHGTQEKIGELFKDARETHRPCCSSMNWMP
ncbi:MAG: AAA family ATPase [Flavobacteriales bacterium]|nr:AAA family ATPase [Flavobacteriales bacterium]